MNICVYAASSGCSSEAFTLLARELGRTMAMRGHSLVNGAGRTGLMAAAAEGCMEAGGQAVGVIPRFMTEQGWQHPSMTRLVVTADMHERKETMARMADACIALPGGVGTLEELLEIITWKQLGLFLKPIVVLNAGGYYDPLLAQLDRAVDERFMRPVHRDIWRVAATAGEAVRMAEETPLWDSSVRKFAAL